MWKGQAHNVFTIILQMEFIQTYKRKKKKKKSTRNSYVCEIYAECIFSSSDRTYDRKLKPDKLIWKENKKSKFIVNAQVHSKCSAVSIPSDPFSKLWCVFLKHTLQLKTKTVFQLSPASWVQHSIRYWNLMAHGKLKIKWSLLALNTASLGSKGEQCKVLSPFTNSGMAESNMSQKTEAGICHL